nr:MAG TPA: hypothetical protein [Caudoviricetes sp.]DAX64453.1 MAG TPA: hypothetical protein [Caudoviricetes sp.]
MSVIHSPPLMYLRFQINLVTPIYLRLRYLSTLFISF